MIKDLIEVMQRGKHCPESIKEVGDISSFTDLVNLMFDYKKELGEKHFPSAAFVRKHYPHLKDTANMNGVFCGEKTLKIQDVHKTILMDDCICDFTLSECRAAYLIIRHKSHVKLNLGDYSKATLYISEKATYEVVNQTRLSRINIVRYE